MEIEKLKPKALEFLRKWWCSLLLLPLIFYSLHQAYWTLHFNIFFAISYDFPFPINIINLFTSNFLLIIHEAGHTFFGIFGWRILTIFGGSLLQILMPAMILIYFWINSIRVGIQLSLYLVGFSFIDVAFYAADATRTQLPLIGDLPDEYHDWHNLLLHWDAMEYDETIALVLTICATLLYIAAVLVPLYLRQYEEVDLELNL